MVQPDNPDELQTGELGVGVVRSEDGRFFGFRDPDTGRFISHADAIPRLRYDVETADLVDSYGAHVGVGSIGLPEAGVSVGYATKAAEYLPLDENPATFQPANNQEVIETVVFVDKDGRLVTLETSYGLGRMYDPNRTGGRWRQAASEVLGLGPDERLPTKDLERAVVLKYFSYKTIN